MGKFYIGGSDTDPCVEIDFSNIVINEIKLLKENINMLEYEITSYENVDLSSALAELPENGGRIKLLFSVHYANFYLVLEAVDLNGENLFYFDAPSLKLTDYESLKEQLLKFHLELPSEKQIKEKLIRDYVQHTPPFEFDNGNEELLPIKNAIVDVLRDKFVFTEGYLDYNSEVMDPIYLELILDVIKSYNK